MSRKVDRLGSLFVELVVVFAGVLIALAADSWIQTRDDVHRTTSYLRAIATDMDSATIEIDRTIARMDEDLSRVSEALELIHSTSALPDTLVTIVMYNGGTADVPMGTMRALVSTGDLELIQDEALRSTLVSEHARLQAAIAAVEQGSAKISNNVDRRIVAEEHLRVDMGLPPGAAIPLRSARMSPDLLAAYRIHRGALTIRLGQFHVMRESASAVQEGVRRVLDGR